MFSFRAIQPKGTNSLLYSKQASQVVSETQILIEIVTELRLMNKTHAKKNQSKAFLNTSRPS